MPIKISFRLSKEVMFQLIREIGYDFNTNLNFTDNALEALQTVGEDYIIQYFSKANLRAIDRNSTTVELPDLDSYRKY